MMNKKYDWMAVLQYQPNYTLADFKDLGVTPDNTEFRSRDYYKGLEAVRNSDFFSNDAGKFDEKKFDQFYDEAALLYNGYANEEVFNNLESTKTYDPWEWWNKNPEQVKDVTPKIVPGENPWKVAYGISGLGRMTESPYSIREMAQTRPYYDVTTGEWSEKTPNDYAGIFKSWTAPTLVLATYDQDETEIDANGRTITHKKGEIKLDPKGLPFYETLGDRDSSGKDFLLREDIFSVDNEGWNKFDIWDADGKRTDPAKVFFKTVARVVPYVLPWGIGKFYAGMKAVQGMAEFLPTFFKSVDGVVTNDVMGNEFGRTMNDLAGFMKRLDHGVSDYSREHLITWENAGKMFADITGQLFEQKSAQKLTRLFKDPAIRNNAKLAKALSYLYMSTTSATEAYDIFKRAGANDRTTGLALWGLIGIYYKLMDAAYYKHALFRNTPIDEESIKEPANKLVKLYQETIAKDPTALGVGTSEEAIKTMNWFQRNWSKLLDVPSKMEGAGLIGGRTVFSSALSEGVEEVMEEVGIDALKGLAKGMEAMGFNVTEANESLDFGYSLEDVLTRYGMSFVGGAFGGAVFHGYNLMDPEYRAYKKLQNQSSTIIGDIVTLVMQGRQNELYEYLAKGYENQEYGSNNLSATKYSIVRDVDGDVVAFEGADGQKSQNEMVYNEVYKTVKFIENVLASEQFKDVLNKVKEVTKLDSEQAAALLFTGQSLINFNAQNLILDDLKRLAEDIVKTTTKMKAIEDANRPTDAAGGEEKLKNILATNVEYQDLVKDLDELRLRRDAIYNKENIASYMEKAVLALNTSILNAFLGFSDVNSYAIARYTKPLAKFTPKEQERIQKEFDAFFDGENVELFEVAHIYNALSERFRDRIMEKDALLSKVSPEENVRAETVGLDTLKKLETIGRLNSNIKQLEAKEDKTEEDNSKLEELRAEKSKLAEEVNSVLGDPQKLVSRLHVGEFNDVEFYDFERALVALYHSLEGKQKYDDVDYNRFLNRVKATFALDLIKRGFEQLIVDKRAEVGADFNPEFESELGKDENEPQNFFWATPWDSDIQIEFFDLLKDFYNLLGSNNEAAIQKYQEIRTLLKDRGKLDDKAIDDILATPLTEIGVDGMNVELGVTLIPKFGEQFLPDVVAEIEESRKKIQYSDAVSLIKDFLMMVDDGTLMPLLELLEREEGRITDIGEYTIGNEFYRKQLLTLFSIVNGISAIVGGAYDGTNEFLNNYRRKEKLNEYAVITENTAKILQNDLTNLKNRIRFILKVDQKNSGQKLHEQRAVGANMRVKFLEKITNHIYIEDFENEFGINLDELIQKHTSAEFNLNDIDAQNYDRFEPEIIAVETAIYEEIQKKGFTSKEIIDKLIKIYGDNNLYKLRSTKLTKEKSEIVTDYDAIIYAFTLMKLHSNDFFALYRDAIKHAKEVAPDFNIVPVFGQEFALRWIYAYAKDKNGFNYLLDQIANSYDGTDEYQKVKRKLYNMANIFGGAGTGKTRGVAAILKYLFPKAEFRLLGPTDTQVQTLLSVFGEAKDSANGKTLNAFKELAFPGVDAEDNLDYDSETKVVTTKEDKSKEFGWFSLEGGLRFMVFDEIAMNNSVILKALSDYAVKNDALLIGLGDPKQNTGKITFKKSDGSTTQPDGFEDTVHLKSPYLVSNFRAAYRSKADNYAELLHLISEVDEKVEEAGGNKTATEYDEILTEINGGNLVKLKQYTTNGLVAGDKIVTNADEFKTLLDKALEQKDVRVLLVTDATTNEKYVDEKYDKVKQDATKAQGGEYDYVFIDKAVNAENGGKYNALKDIYTISQRSTLGSVIFDANDDYKKKLGIISLTDPSSIAAWEMNEYQRSEFNQWRMKPLEGLTPSENFDENVKIEGTPSDVESEPIEKPEPKPEPEAKPEPETKVEEGKPVEEEKEEPETEKVPEEITEEETKPAEDAEPAKPASPAVPTAKPPKITVTTEETETIELKPWAAQVAKDFEDDYENAIGRGPATTEGHFKVDEFFNVLFTPGFYNSEKAKKNSAYSFLKANKIELTEKQYQTFVLWASRKILQNDFDFTNFKNLSIDSNQIKRVFKNLSLSFARTVREGDKTVIYAVFSDIKGDVQFEMPVAYTPLMKEGLINLEGVEPFTIVDTIGYDHSNEEVISIRQLRKRYPWLNFSDIAGTVVKASFEEDSSKTRYAQKWIERNLGKTLMVAFGIVPHDQKTLFQTDIHPNGEVWIGQDPINTRKFAIQRIIEDYEDVFLYAAAMNFLYSFDSDSEEYLKKHGWISGRHDAKADVLNRLYKLTGNPKWNAKILKTDINKTTKDPNTKRELWGAYFSALKEADSDSSLISWAQTERVLADLIGSMLRENGNKDAWLKFHGKFHKLNDRSFGLVIKLDPEHSFMIYSDSKAETPGKIYVSEFNQETYRPERVIKEFNTNGNPNTFETEFKNAINAILGLTTTPLTLEDFNSTRVRVSAIDISWNDDGTINTAWISDSLRNWFNVFNPNSLTSLEKILNSDQYKHQLYGNIPVSGKLYGSKLMSSEVLSDYVTRAVKWRGEIIYIDPSIIIPQTSENPSQTAAIQADGHHLIDRLVDFVNSRHLLPAEEIEAMKNRYLDELDKNMNAQDYDLETLIQNAVSEINNYVLQNASSQYVSQIEFNGIDFIATSTSALEYAYPNLIRDIYGDELNDALEITRMSLSGIDIVTGEDDEVGPVNYIFFTQDGELKVIKTHTYGDWTALKEAASELAALFGTEPDVGTDTFKQARRELNNVTGYFNRLLTNSVLPSDVTSYWRIISSFKQDVTLSEAAFKVQDMLEQYLISRINNDEC